MAAKKTQGTTVSLKIPGELLEAFTNGIGYQAEVPDPDKVPPMGSEPGPGPQMPNPQSRKDFAAEHLANYVHATAANWKMSDVQRLAMEQAQGIQLPEATVG
jgi:hypothetical protein